MSGVSAVAIPVQRTAGPRWFRFTDTNLLSGKAYLASRWDDLPYSVAVAVERLWGLRPHEWAELVLSGEITDVVGGREYPLPYTLDLPVRAPRKGRAPAGSCPDCWGTGVDIDSDGSISGTVGSSVVCTCVQMDKRAARAGVSVA
jgi:hypothetical protein